MSREESNECFVYVASLWPRHHSYVDSWASATASASTCSAVASQVDDVRQWPPLTNDGLFLMETG